jgi:hypothetical protein
MILDRRELVKALGLAGALPFTAAPQPPRLFAPKQYELLGVLCERIVPGAAEARVAEFIDLLASENEEYQRRLTGGMAWLDSACRDRYDTVFLDSSADQQEAVLDLIAYRRNADGDSSLQQGIDFFAFLRSMTLDGYFTSRVGIAYLGYSGNGMLSEFPGCPAPEKLP